MPQCPLCESKLVDDECPVCCPPESTRSEGLDRTKRDTPAVQRKRRLESLLRREDDEKASWYAAAGMERPDPEVLVHEPSPDEGLPRPSFDSAEDRGHTTAGLLLLSVVAGHLLGFAIHGGGFLRLMWDAVLVGTAFSLFSGSSRARLLVYLCILIQLVQAGILALVSIPAALVSATAALLLLGALFAHDRWVRWTAVGIGAAFSIGLPLLQAALPAPDLKKQLTKLAIPGGHYRDAEYRFEMQAPPGLLLFGQDKIDMKRGRSRFGDQGLLGLVSSSDEASKALEAKPPQLMFLAPETDLLGFVQARTVPAQIPMDRELDWLDSFVPGRARLTRADQIVPLPMKEFEHSGWSAELRGGFLYVVVARTPDGRGFLVGCLSSAARLAADRRCAEALNAVSILP